MAKEKVSIEVLIETAKSTKNIDELKKTIDELNDELNYVDKSDAFENLSEALEVAEQNMAALVIESDNANLTLSELALKQEALNEAIRDTDRGTDAFAKLRDELVAVNTEIATAESGISGLSNEDVAGAVGQLGGAVGNLTTAFVLLGGEGNKTVEEIAQNIELAMGVTQGLQGAIEGVSSVTKLWQKYGAAIKQSAAFQKVATVVQYGLNLAMSLNPAVAIALAIGALISAIAIFISTSNEAEEEAERLNGQLEEQKKAYDNLVSALDRMDTARKRELDNNARLIKSQIAVLEAISNRTEEEEKQLQSLQQQLDGIDLEKLDVTIQTAHDKFGGLAEQIATQFEIIDQTIKATDYEDGMNDIDYSLLNSKNERLKNEFEEMLSKGFTAENVDEQIKNIDKLSKEQSQFVAQLTKESKALDSAEMDIFEGAIEGASGLEESYETLLENAIAYKNSIGDKGVLKAEKDLEKQAEANLKLSEERQKRLDALAEKRKQDAEDEKQRLIDLKAFKEQLYQSELQTAEALQLRQLQLQFEANEKKAKELVKDDKELTEILARLWENYRNEIEQINKDIVDADKEKIRLIQNANTVATDNIRLIELQKKLLITDNAKEIEQIEKEIRDARIIQIKNNSQIELQNAELTAEQRIEIVKQRELDIAQIEAEAEELRKEKEIEKAEQDKEIREQINAGIIEVAQNLSDSLFEIAEQRRQRDLDRELETLQEKTDFEKDQINRRVRNGLISERVANKEREKLEKERLKEEEKIKKEAFEKDKKAKIIQANINIALSIMSALAGSPPPANFIMAGITGALGAIQLATIKSQKYAKGGILQGASHDNGGIPTPFGELEGGEAVINKKSSKLFRNELSMINEAGGGVKFAKGGILGSEKEVTSNGNLTSVLNQLNEQLQSPIKSYVVEAEITSAQNKNNQLERNATI